MQDIKTSSYKLRRTRVRVLFSLAKTYGIALVLVFLAGVLTLAAWRMYGRVVRAGEGETAAQAQLERAQAQQAAITEHLKKLQTSTGQEGELRHRYGMARPGEGVIQIVQAVSTSSNTQPKDSTGFFGWILRIFFP